MALDIALLLCPFTITLNIFTLKDTTKTHSNNVGFNIPHNAPLVVYLATLVGHWLVMGLKTNNSSVDAWLSKMEVTIKNIVSFVVACNLAVNQLMEHEVVVAITTKVTSAEEPKWTMTMAKNVHQVVSWAMETLADTPKHEERKLNLCLMGFEAKEGETEKELVQRLNSKSLQGQLRLCVKVIAAMR